MDIKLSRIYETPTAKVTVTFTSKVTKDPEDEERIAEFNFISNRGISDPTNGEWERECVNNAVALYCAILRK